MRLHKILLPVLILPGSAIAACDTDLFASSTCERASLWSGADQPPGSTGLVTAAEVTEPLAANDADAGDEGQRSAVSGPDSED